MTLKDEIAAVRAEINARARRTPAEESSSSSSAAPYRQQAGGTPDRHDVETLMKMMNDRLNEFAEEPDRSGCAAASEQRA